jgi:cyclopropane-fatty-acyl-phospholipid synthase
MTTDITGAGEGPLGRFIVAIGKRLMPRELKGSLVLTLPSGRAITLGTPGEGIDADLALDNWRPVVSSVARASLGFSEAYLDGHWHSSDPAKLIRFYLQNRNPLDGAGHKVFFQSVIDRIWHLRRDNSKNGSRRNIAEHYDLGNEFYQHWLDPTMTYSSGRYAGGTETLEASQHAKYRLILDALEIEQGHDVLEIGCGWGGFAEAAGRAGAKVRAITLSAEQLAYTRNRLETAGLASDCAVHLEDYRDTKGAFDRIASIEMIEAVGEARWPHYFETLRTRLKPGGVAVIQAITIAPENYEGYRRRVDFIQRYVFPGGMLPTDAIMRDQAHSQGLTFERHESFGQCYARTLKDWRERFEAKWPEIAGLGFDNRFRRLWRYYLAYCEAGFAEKAINVGVYRLRRPA